MPTKKPMENEQHPRPAHAPTQEEMRTAHQIHTLAQMLYGRLAMTNPWLATPPTLAEPTAGFAQMPWAQSWPAQPGFGPGAGARQAPWMHAWPAQTGFHPQAPLAQVPWMHGWPTQVTAEFPPAAGFHGAPWGYPMWGPPYGYFV